jgi:hypothetical protein
LKGLLMTRTTRLCSTAFLAMLLACAAPATAADDIVGVGNFSHIVQDLDRSLAFYRDVLGLEVTTSVPFSPKPGDHGARQHARRAIAHGGAAGAGIGAGRRAD